MQPPQRQQPLQSELPMNNTPLPVILSSQPQRRVAEKYNVKSVKIVSIIQIVLGSLAIFLQIWDIINETQTSIFGAGIWTGALFIMAGSFGVVSSNNKRTCAIIYFLVMSILASVFTIGLLITSSINVTLNNWRRDSIYRQYRYPEDYYYGEKPDYLEDTYLEGEMRRLDKIVIISTILLLISLTEAVVAIVSSCYACHGLCASISQQGNVLIQGQVQYIPGPNGQTQMVIIPMQNQTNLMTANPPYQLTTPSGGFQPQPLAAPQGEIARGHGVSLSMPEVHQANSTLPSHPPAYSEQTTPPPKYEEKEKSTSG